MSAQTETELLERLMEETMGNAPEFKPCAFVDGLDDLVVLGGDCSFSEEDVPGMPFSLFRRMHDPTNKIVGVRIPRAFVQHLLREAAMKPITED